MSDFDYKIVQRDPTTGVVTIDPPFPPQRIEGIDKLVQIVVLAIFNTPGRSAQFPSQGGGFPALLGTNINLNDPTESIAAVTERIEKIRDEIIANQSSLENESPSERLSDLLVLNVDTGVNIDSVEVKLRLISEGGDLISLVV